MACRLVNLHHQPLRIELRGGGAFILAPQANSQALREELLYDNPHLGDWERAGWLRRLPARMSEVLAAEQPAQPARRPARAKAGARTAAKPPEKSGTAGRSSAKRPAARKNGK